MLRDQRERLLAAVPGVVAEHGYEAMSVADIVKAAGVSRNAFYSNFKDKQECFAAAHERGHERLFDLLAQRCDAGAGIEERVELSLSVALEALASDPDLARLLFVEAAAAGRDIALRYHAWLQRYGTLLRFVAVDEPDRIGPQPEVEGVIVGGIASRLASEVLEGRGGHLRELTGSLTAYVIAFFPRKEPAPEKGKIVPFEQQESEPELYEADRRQAGA